MKNICLSYLMSIENLPVELAMAQFAQSDNLTDRMAALSTLSHTQTVQRQQAFATFYQQWHQEPLLMDKWFMLQALSEIPTALNDVTALLEHELFTFQNPNKVRALISGFANNFSAFHAEDGSGYQFIQQQVLVMDRINANVAASIVQPLTFWKRYDQQRQKLMKQSLQVIMEQTDLSKNVYEMVKKSLINN